jgi:hypothetical protein
MHTSCSRVFGRFITSLARWKRYVYVFAPLASITIMSSPTFAHSRRVTPTPQFTFLSRFPSLSSLDPSRSLLHHISTVHPYPRGVDSRRRRGWQTACPAAGRESHLPFVHPASLCGGHHARELRADQSTHRRRVRGWCGSLRSDGR